MENYRRLIKDADFQDFGFALKSYHIVDTACFPQPMNHIIDAEKIKHALELLLHLFRIRRFKQSATSRALTNGCKWAASLNICDTHSIEQLQIAEPLVPMGTSLLQDDSVNDSC